MPFPSPEILLGRVFLLVTLSVSRSKNAIGSWQKHEPPADAREISGSYGGHGLPKWLSDEESTCQYRRLRRLVLDPWVKKIPWRRKWQPIQVFLSGESHGQRNLTGYRSWSGKESDMAEQTHTPIEFHRYENKIRPLSTKETFIMPGSKSL